MTRPLRIDDPGGWHHVMNRGADHQPIYFGDGDRLNFEALYEDLASEYGIEIHAYCLMSNHYHALLHCPHAGLSKAMQHLSSSYTRITNERLDRDGPIFRGRFHSVSIQSERQLALCAAYIHRNPVDLVPANALDAYRWSSYGVYLGKRLAPAWLSQDAVGALLPPDEHRALVTALIPDPTALIDAAVGALPGVGEPDGRHARLLIGADTAKLSATELTAWLGFGSPGATRTALTRVRAHCCSSPEFDALVTSIRRCLPEFYSAPRCNDGV